MKTEHTNSGTSLLIISWTLVDKLELFAKFTRYFKEKVSETCWFISMRIPAMSSSSPFFDLLVLAFLLGLEGAAA